MGEHYPELASGASLIASVTEQEEVRFRADHRSRARMLDDELAKMNAARAAASLPGDAAFKLYDTYGFPSISPRSSAEKRGSRSTSTATRRRSRRRGAQRVRRPNRRSSSKSTARRSTKLGPRRRCASPATSAKRSEAQWSR